MTGLREFIFGVGALATLIGIDGCNSSTATSPVSAGDNKNQPTVAVTHPTREDLSHTVSLTAEFRPYQEVDVHAKGFRIRAADQC